MKREQWSGPDNRKSPSRHRLCRSQAALHGASGAPRPKMECPQRHHATNHRIKTWGVTELYGRNGVGGCKHAAEIVYAVSSGGFLTVRV